MHPLSGYNVTASGTATGTIVNTDEATVSIVDSNWWFPWVLERDTVNSPYRFHVRLSKQVDAPVTVFYATADGTATAGLDYVAKSGSVVIPAYSDGVDDAIEITIIGDTINEWHETFKVKATGDDDGGGGGRNVNSFGVEATGTINDDD
jgi:chitinase